MMKATTEVMLETVIMSALNIAAVYVSAFTYNLNWSGVLTVMIIASLLTATVTHFLISKAMAVKVRAEAVVSEGLAVLAVALLSSLAILIILVQRFNLPQALGIALLSGILSSLIHHLLA